MPVDAILRRQAEELAAMRGHQLGEWQPTETDPEADYARCVRCGAIVNVHPGGDVHLAHGSGRDAGDRETPAAMPSIFGDGVIFACGESPIAQAEREQ